MSDKKIDRAADKVPLNLVPMASLAGPARVAEHGKVKYSLGNWHQANDGDIANRYMGGLLRHIMDAQRPDGYFDLKSISKLDDESGLPEIDHAIMGLLMLRGLCIKNGVLPRDPGKSKLVDATDRADKLNTARQEMYDANLNPNAPPKATAENIMAAPDRLAGKNGGKS